MLRNLLRVVCLVMVVAGLWLMFNDNPRNAAMQPYGVYFTLTFGLMFLALFVKRAI